MSSAARGRALDTGEEPATDGKGKRCHNGNIAHGSTLRAQLQRGRSGRPCSSTSEGTGDSGGWSQPGKEGRSKLRRAKEEWDKEKRKSAIVAPGENDGRKDEA